MEAKSKEELCPTSGPQTPRILGLSQPAGNERPPTAKKTPAEVRSLIGMEAVPSGYPNPTCYPVFLLIPDPTRFIFGNDRVAGNPKHRVLPDISGKPEVSGTTRYFGYHP